MSSNPFSATVEAFGVVGFADVILRSVVSLSGLVSRAAAANETAGLLLAVLRDLASVISSVQVWAKAYAESDFALKDGQVVSTQVTSLLADCQRRLDSLSHVLNEVVAANPRTWTWAATRVKFGLREVEIRQATQILEYYKTSLNTLFQIRNSNDLIILRRGQGTAGKHLRNIRDNMATLISDSNTMTDTLQGIEQSMLQTSSLVTSTASAALSSDGAIKRIEAAITPGLDAIQNSLQKQEDSTASTVTMMQRILSEFEDSRKVIQHLDTRVRCTAHSTQSQSRQEEIVNVPFQKIDTSSQVSSLSFTESSDYNVLVEGDNLEDIILPVRLIHSLLSQAIDTVARSGAQIITQDKVDWFMSEMDSLLRFAYRSASINEPTYPSRNCGASLKRPGSWFWTVPVEASAFFRDSSGFLVVEYAESSDSLHRKTRRFRFACFATGIPLLASGLCGHFEATGPDISKIQRQLRVFNVVSSMSDAFIYARNNNLQGLKKLFSEQKASPLDYSQHGDSLLAVAANRFHYDIVSFLLQQGADPHLCRLGHPHIHDLLDVLWKHLPFRDPSGAVESALKASKLTSLAMSVGFRPDHDKIADIVRPQFNRLGYGEWLTCLANVNRQLPLPAQTNEAIIEGAPRHTEALSSLVKSVGLSPLYCTLNILRVFKIDTDSSLWDEGRHYVDLLLLDVVEGDYEILVRHLMHYKPRGPGDVVNLPVAFWMQALYDELRSQPWTVPEHSTAEIIDLLLERGADIDTRTAIWRRTPLILAAIKSDHEFVSMLLFKGASIEARASDSRTALSYAAQHATSEVVSLLLRHGADVTSVCSEGYTPIDYAMKFNTKVTELLQSRDRFLTGRRGHRV